jgi:hypothetical protein
VWLESTPANRVGKHLCRFAAHLAFLRIRRRQMRVGFRRSNADRSTPPKQARLSADRLVSASDRVTGPRKSSAKSFSIWAAAS